MSLTLLNLISGESKYSTLSIYVPSDAPPSDAPPGTYNHTVNATATYDVPYPPFTATQDVTTDVETTVIPEFQTIAIPAASIFVLLFFIRRRARK